jgi:uncharacterized tellurite resistance protein B-like protein
MLKALSDILEKAFQSGTESSVTAREHGLQLATAVLLVEVARADYAEALVEEDAMRALLKDNFDIGDEETTLLLADAKAEADHAASLQSFTRELHEQLTLEEKHRIVAMLWRVAFADDHLDRYEDHVVRKIAGLLYVSHGDLIRIRNRIEREGETRGISPRRTAS